MRVLRRTSIGYRLGMLATCLSLACAGTTLAEAPPGAKLDARHVDLAQRLAELEARLPLPIGRHETTQHVIPRYGHGATHPAGALRGSGPGTVLTATADTKEAIVTTEDYEHPLAKVAHGANEEGHKPAVLQPVVRDITIAGFDDSGRDSGEDSRENYSAKATVGGQPRFDNVGDPALYDGLRINASGAHVENVDLTCIPGTALVSKRHAPPANGPHRPGDRVAHTYQNVSVTRCYDGLDISAVDSKLSIIQAQNVRGFGLRTPYHVMASQVHVWGAGVGWRIGNRNMGSQVYLENSRIGGLFEGGHSRLSQVYSHSCTEANFRILGEHNRLADGELHVSHCGIDVRGRGFTAEDLEVTVPPKGIGVRLHRTAGRNHQQVVLSDLTFSGGGRYIVAEGRLVDARIDALFIGGTIGLDLVDNQGNSMLGPRNVIHITARDCKTPIELPDRFDSSNVVTINGKRIK